LTTTGKRPQGLHGGVGLRRLAKHHRGEDRHARVAEPLRGDDLVLRPGQRGGRGRRRAPGRDQRSDQRQLIAAEPRADARDQQVGHLDGAAWAPDRAARAAQPHRHLHRVDAEGAEALGEGGLDEAARGVQRLEVRDDTDGFAAHVC
jgi:hypothetical protein